MKEPAVPLDDSYIHFQFARALAELRPFQYVASEAPVAGATSLLWPILLAPFWALGVRGTGLIWVAWAFSFLSLGLLAFETQRLARKLLSPTSALAAGAMVLSFGGLLWSAGSGMEVVPFAWLLMASGRLAADWSEREDDASRLEPRLLIVTAVAASWMRPEGFLALLIVAAVLRLRPRGTAPWLPLLALALVLSGPLFQFAFTGQLRTTTSTVKWLFASPYRAAIWPAIKDHVSTFFDTLLDGRLWSLYFIPTGSKYVGALVLPALCSSLLTTRYRVRASITLVLALAIFIPTTYDTYLVNRLRYLWPFAPAWFIGLGLLGDRIGELSERVARGGRTLGRVFSGLCVGALFVMQRGTVTDLAACADAIHRQQVALGYWAAGNLPTNVLIGVNDAGAITYFSGRRTFDVVGLTTASEGKYWAAGPGSRFEHYERLGAARLPTHFIVYPQWMAVPAVIGEELTSRSVYGSTILGGPTMSAHRADWSSLGSGARPTLVPLGTLVDELDVSDLESEAEHRYQLLNATQYTNLVYEDGAGHVDGGRKARVQERFELKLSPNGQLLARVVSKGSGNLDLSIDGAAIGSVHVEDGRWSEARFKLPANLAEGVHSVHLTSSKLTSFAALHYWSVR